MKWITMKNSLPLFYFVTIFCVSRVLFILFFMFFNIKIGFIIKNINFAVGKTIKYICESIYKFSFSFCVHGHGLRFENTARHARQS